MQAAAPLLLSLVGCSSPVDCSILSCESGATWQRTLSVATADLTILQVTICRNGACASGGVRAPTEPGGDYICDLSGAVQASCSLTPSSGTSATLNASASIAVAVAVDGDEYELRVAVGQSPPPLIDEKVAASYAVLQPNGPECAPTCKLATL